MRETAQPAVVLHRRAYRETSFLVELLTRDHGRIGAVARGAQNGRRSSGLCLQPFQLLLVDWDSRGELVTLRGSEPASTPVLLSGDQSLVGLYLNEICVRLLARGDPQPQLLEHYQSCLAGLAAGDAAWSMRRFERELFAGAGYALPLVEDAQGSALQRERLYHVEPDQGAHVLPMGVAESTQGIRGSALLDLGADIRPDDADLRALRGLARAWLNHYLGGRALNSWELMRAARAQRKTVDRGKDP